MRHANICKVMVRLLLCLLIGTTDVVSICNMHCWAIYALLHCNKKLEKFLSFIYFVLLSSHKFSLRYSHKTGFYVQSL